jgi:hypothetical protein
MNPSVSDSSCPTTNNSGITNEPLPASFSRTSAGSACEGANRFQRFADSGTLLRRLPP